MSGVGIVSRETTSRLRSLPWLQGAESRRSPLENPRGRAGCGLPPPRRRAAAKARCESAMQPRHKPAAKVPRHPATKPRRRGPAKAPPRIPTQPRHESPRERPPPTPHATPPPTPYATRGEGRPRKSSTQARYQDPALDPVPSSLQSALLLEVATGGPYTAGKSPEHDFFRAHCRLFHVKLAPHTAWRAVDGAQ